MAALRFACPKCKTTNQTTDREAGQVVACSKCGQKLRVPAAKKTAAAPGGQEPIDILEEVDGSEERDGRQERPSRSLPRRSRGNDREDDDDRDRERPARRSRDDDLDDDEYDAAERETRPADLGPVVREYEASLFWVVLGITASIIGIVVGFVFAVVAAFGAVPMACGSLFLWALGGAGIFFCIRSIGYKVVLHEGGFVEVRRSGKLAVSWDDIGEVYQQITEHYTNGIYTGTTYLYTVKTREGRTFRFTNNLIKNIKKFGETLMHEAAQAIFPRKMRTFERGGVAEFGKLGVSKEGLSYGNSLLDWDDVDDVQIKAGYIHVSKRGKWFNWCNIAVSSVPNVYIFMALVNQIVGVDD